MAQEEGDSLLPSLVRPKQSSSSYDKEAAKRDPVAPHRPSLTRLAITTIVLFLTLGLAFRPLRKCYHRVRVYCHRTKSLEERVEDILSNTPLIDGHNDLPILIRVLYNNHIYNDNFTKPFEEGGLYGQVDLPRLKQGKNGGAFWSVFTPCPERDDDFSDENYAASVQFTLQQIDLVTRLQTAYPKILSSMLTSSTAMDVFKAGQLISPLGIEGLHQIGNSVANLRRFYQLGVRYATLTHNCHNKFADAAIVGNPPHKAEPYWGGVSPLGRRLVAEMNRIGMIVDLAHTSDGTMVDVLGGNDWQGSRAPIIFSHSSAFSICPHPRNVKNHILQLVKERNSVVMVNFSPDFIACVESGNENGLPESVPENATLSQVVKHIMHIGNYIGYDHVGLGSDFDGIPSTPKGLEDVSKYPDLVAELLKQGVSDEDASKIVGGNLLRVWKEVDAVASKMQSAGEPIMEDDLAKLFSEHAESDLLGIGDL